jgi:molybdopterin-guanine dinucleotide biosynthesis protein A
MRAGGAHRGVATALGMIARQCSGAVLAGGGSRRFGGLPKGLCEVGGRRIVDRVIDALRSAADECFLISNDPDVAGVTGVPIYGDARPERASLVGLHSALVHCRDAALVVAWDMPFVSTHLLEHLRAVGERAAAAVIPSGPRGPEPLCAYYPRSALAVVEAQLDRGERRLSSFLAALGDAVVLSPKEVAAFGPVERLFANINSPADLALARELSASEPIPFVPIVEHR